jgi:hypothetical protein
MKIVTEFGIIHRPLILGYKQVLVNLIPIGLVLIDNEYILDVIQVLFDNTHILIKMILQKEHDGQIFVDVDEIVLFGLFNVKVVILIININNNDFYPL